MAFGAAMGAMSGSLRDFGINEEFINQVRDDVTEGTSALFLMSSGALRDRIRERIDVTIAGGTSGTRAMVVAGPSGSIGTGR